MGILRHEFAAGQYVVTRVGTQPGDHSGATSPYAMTSLIHASAADAMAVAELGVPRTGPDGSMLRISLAKFKIKIFRANKSYPHLDTGTPVLCNICKLESVTP